MSQDSKPEDDATQRSAIPQAGCVPIRLRAGHSEVCLITSRGTGQWGFPKGYIEAGDGRRHTALKETFEEAGVLGDIVREVNGYRYSRRGREYAVTMYLLQVTEVLDDWPERDQRQRRWVHVDAAEAYIDRPELVPVLRSAIDALERRA